MAEVIARRLGGAVTLGKHDPATYPRGLPRALRYPIPVVEFFQSVCDVRARLVCVTLDHGQRLVAADALHGRKVDACLDKVCDRCVSEGVTDDLFRIQPRSCNAADECLADIHGVSLTCAWRGEEPLSAWWQRLHVLREELRQIGRNRLCPGSSFGVGQ